MVKRRRIPISLKDLHTFNRIVDAGSIEAAALQMRVPTALVARRLKKLEDFVGVQLIVFQDDPDPQAAKSQPLSPEAQAKINLLKAHFDKRK